LLNRFSSVTDTTTKSSRRYGIDRKKRLKHRLPSHEMDRASSVSSLTESTMSLNIITVTLNMGMFIIYWGGKIKHV
jgi:segment polarity protein dishevelled